MQPAAPTPMQPAAPTLMQPAAPTTHQHGARKTAPDKDQRCRGILTSRFFPYAVLIGCGPKQAQGEAVRMLVLVLIRSLRAADAAGSTDADAASSSEAAPARGKENSAG
ncbi:hypothetical protein [Mycetocola sp. 2940]|uniref:hypothetical protein n=1 Tax=Mycetocola sp. 2940 TaxID=3156452 RepID=UPI003395503F